MKVLTAHEFMMGGRMVLGKVISAVELSWGPVQVELLLGNTIFEPVIAHVKSFGFFHADCGVENTVSRGIVGFQGSASRRLFVAHFFKGSDHGNSLLGVEKKTTGFGFGGRGSNSANGFAEDMNSTIGLGIRRGGDGTVEASQEKMSGCSAASIGKDEIGGIGADGEDHVACVVPDRGIGMSGKVVEKHVAGLLGVLCR